LTIAPKNRIDNGKEKKKGLLQPAVFNSLEAQGEERKKIKR